MNNSLSRLYSKGPPKKRSTLIHLIDYLTPLIDDTFCKPATALYYFPTADSDLGKQCGDAFRVLRKLEEDEDFQAFLNEKPRYEASLMGDYPYSQISSLLSSPRNPIPTPAEEFTLGEHTVVLRKCPIYWDNDINVLLDIYYKVGNGLKSDGSVRLDLVLNYYSINPANPQDRQQWQAVLNALAELRAAHTLGHQGHLSDLQHLLDDAATQTLKSAVRNIESREKKSLLELVLPAKLTASEQGMLDNTPTVLLERLLRTPQNLKVAKDISQAMGWHSAQATDTHPTHPVVKLLLQALWTTLAPDPNAPYDNELKLLIVPGSDYPSIRQSLIKNYQYAQNLSPAAAQLALCVVKMHIPSEVWVADIPPDLAYGVSSAWVSFKSGFLLAESLAPGSSRHMRFEQLLNLAAEHFRTHADDPAQQALVAAAKVQPTLQWAQANGLLPIRHNGYSKQEIIHAFSTLEEHERTLTQTVQNLVLQPPSRFRYASDALHEQAFNKYLQGPKTAYCYLIKSLLAQAFAAAQCEVDHDEITLYALRQPLRDTQVEQENKRHTDAMRGRSGFIVRMVSTRAKVVYIEIFPAAGVFRVRKDIRDLPVGGEIKVKNTGASSRSSKAAFRYGTELNVDWQAYREGKKPRPNQKSTLIVEQIGRTLPVIHSRIVRSESFASDTLWSPRSSELAQMVADELFFCDEQALLEKTRKATRELDIGRDLLEEISFWGKMIVPFWGAIDDLASGDPQRIETGGLGLFTDIVAFALPIGRYIAGCSRLVIQAGKAGIRLALPRFTQLTLNLLASTLQQLNPLDGVIDLLRLGRFAMLKLGQITVRQLGKRISLLQDGTNAVGHMRPADPASWRPSQAGDGLFVVDGFERIPMRNIGSANAPDYRLIDPMTNLTFGPRYRPPVTVISNQNPLLRPYAVQPHRIAGLTADSRGIFFRPEYNQKFICNVDERGRIEVYQIRENSYSYIAETAKGQPNSFSVVLVDPRTNRDLPMYLTSVERGRWYSIGLKGGAPEQTDAITPPLLRAWTETAETALAKATQEFSRKHNLDPRAINQFVYTRPMLTPRGNQMLDREGTARADITYKHLDTWRKCSQSTRNRLTLDGFAFDRNLDPVALRQHINADGTLRDAGKVLEHDAKNLTFTPMTYKHVAKWQKLYRARYSPSMRSFIEQMNLNPVLWSSYVKPNGALTLKGKHAVLFGERIPADAPLAAKSAPLERQAQPAADTQSSSSEHPGADTQPSTRERPGAAPQPSTSKRPAAAPQPSTSKRPAAAPQPSTSKRPRLDNPQAPTPLAPAPSHSHQINNAAPILQDPRDIRISLTEALEGPVGKIRITNDNSIFAGLNPAKKARVQQNMIEDIHEWIAEEGQHHERFSNLFEVRKLDNGPDRGLSLIARHELQQFDVLGPYSGKLHLDEQSLNQEIFAKSRDAVGTYLFETHTPGALISGHGNSNVLSVINSHQVPGQPPIGKENVASVCVGKYMVFLIAWDTIPAGTELLMDYGPRYWQHIAKITPG